MLRDFVESNHYLFAQEADSWEEAIRMSCKSLEADGTVESNYADAIIECINEYGPYIILMPLVAMPHSQERAVGVKRTAMAFMRLEKPVSFDPQDPEKDAQLFFTFASCNHDEHLQNIVKLSELLLKEELVAELLKSTSAEDLIKLQEKYLD